MVLSCLEQSRIFLLFGPGRPCKAEIRPGRWGTEGRNKSPVRCVSRSRCFLLVMSADLTLGPTSPPKACQGPQVRAARCLGCMENRWKPAKREHETLQHKCSPAPQNGALHVAPVPLHHPQLSSPASSSRERAHFSPPTPLLEKLCLN